MNISGKVAIITGASAGIGLAAARRFAAEGAKVVLAARSADKLIAIAEELRGQGHEALPLPADMCNKAAVDRMVEQAFRHYGHIDILINNAGQAAAGTVADVSVDDFRQILDLNVFGPVYAIQAVVPKMRQGGGGLIINISSMVSKMHIPGLGGLCRHKSGVKHAFGNSPRRTGPREHSRGHFLSPDNLHRFWEALPGRPAASSKAARLCGFKGYYRGYSGAGGREDTRSGQKRTGRTIYGQVMRLPFVWQE